MVVLQLEEENFFLLYFGKRLSRQLQRLVLKLRLWLFDLKGMNWKLKERDHRLRWLQLPIHLFVELSSKCMRKFRKRMKRCFLRIRKDKWKILHLSLNNLFHFQNNPMCRDNMLTSKKRKEWMGSEDLLASKMQYRIEHLSILQVYLMNDKEIIFFFFVRKIWVWKKKKRWKKKIIGEKKNQKKKYFAFKTSKTQCIKLDFKH